VDILLDTHAVLWFLEGNEKMPYTARDTICNAENNIYVSIVSLWEVAIKVSGGKLTLVDGIEGFTKAVEENGFLLLEVAPEHIKVVADLPFIHRDPFDRMLVAQAIVSDMSIMTIDDNIAKYDINSVW